MKTKFIKIKNMDELKTFMEKVYMVDGDVTAKRGKFIVDAKSMLGLMSINVAEGCIINFPNNAKDFENYLSSLD